MFVKTQCHVKMANYSYRDQQFYHIETNYNNFRMSLENIKYMWKEQNICKTKQKCTVYIVACFQTHGFKSYPHIGMQIIKKKLPWPNIGACLGIDFSINYWADIQWRHSLLFVFHIVNIFRICMCTLIRWFDFF